MARELSSPNDEDEDYIDMEVSSSSTFSYSINSPQQTREFEFQMSSSTSPHRESTISPADDLFYKGNLLPLHIPPRLQMLQNLLTNSINTSHENKIETFKENYITKPMISPSYSCPASGELNPNEYLLECSNELTGFIDEQPKKSWSNKLNLIKQSSLGMKLKTSSTYLKSLFTKSGCPNEGYFDTSKKMRAEEIVSRGKECLKKYIKVGKRYYPFGQVHNKDKMNNEDHGYKRRSSFSEVIKQCSSSSSHSSLFSSSNPDELHLLKRSKSDNYEIESAVQGAISHCNQSTVRCSNQERL